METAKQPECEPLLTVRSFGLTDCGKVRESNEDNFLIAVLVKALQVKLTSLPQPKFQHSSDRSYLFIVAMGWEARLAPRTPRRVSCSQSYEFSDAGRRSNDVHEYHQNQENTCSHPDGYRDGPRLPIDDPYDQPHNERRKTDAQYGEKLFSTHAPECTCSGIRAVSSGRRERHAAFGWWMGGMGPPIK